MFLGLYTRKEVNEEKLKSYQNGYDDGAILMNNFIKQLNFKSEKIYELVEENRELKHKARAERHEEVRQIRAIANRTKKSRVKKKCEARLLKIRLSR
ncbi:hypothetical protein [Terrisporobacter sp.]|uniref:hypothetical protein n=1 Tax=Terrisporobacter sp. TaxID=1965305 RepID=UPI00289F8B52|nr:hypothetical protein [Terrisporobacter sp.]